jgi:hypothetical protein
MLTLLENNKMKLLTMIVLTIVLMAAPTSLTKTQGADLDLLAQTLCDLAKNNGRSKMRKKLKAAKLRLRSIYTGITCAGDDKFTGGSLLRMATAHGAIDSANFLATKAGKAALAYAEHDGKNIIEWTQSMIDSGDADKQEFLELYQSKI